MKLTPNFITPDFHTKEDDLLDMKIRHEKVFFS